MSQRMRYDAEDDVLMIWFAEGETVDHAEQIGKAILHVTEEGEPILLEIMDARNDHNQLLDIVPPEDSISVLALFQ